MKISTKLHGTLDYLTAFLLIASPWIFNFNGNKFHMGIAVTTGFLVLLNNVLTDYEYGIFRLLKMEFHLAADILIATILITSSWLLDVSDSVLVLFLILSITQAVTCLITRNKPYNHRKTNNFQSLKINY